MRNGLLELALQCDDLAELDPAARRLALREMLLEHDSVEDLPRSLVELANAIDGFGPLTELMEEDAVTDILVNGPHEIWVERLGRLELVPHGFRDHTDLRAFIDRVLASTGARADAGHPVADARLRDGSRIHVVLSPIAPRGPQVSIRRFPSRPLSLDDLADAGMFDDDILRSLVSAVQGRRTLAISGGTGSGKTTLLNALLGQIDDTERVVVLEETAELRPACPHHVSLVTRSSNVEGTGAVTLADLVRASLRMRPDRIVIGEVRGGEALAALAAMSVGHEGSMVTVHARSAKEVHDRLVSLALLASTGASESSLHQQASAAFDLVLHLERDRWGRRRVVEIVESGT